MINSCHIYQEKKRQLFEELGNHAIGSLATCYDGKPYVRSISCVLMDENIYFQSDRTMQKVIHIAATPFVSVCFRHIQVQGICVELEHPLHPLSKSFFQLFAEYYPHAAQRYSHLNNERVYQIIPNKIETWRYIDGAPYQEVFDMESKSYQSHKYEI